MGLDKKRKKEKMKKSFLKKKISRRQFIKKGLAAAAGIGLGIYGLSRIFSEPENKIGSGTLSNSAPEKLWKWSKEAYEYAHIVESSVKCGLCQHR